MIRLRHKPAIAAAFSTLLLVPSSGVRADKVDDLVREYLTKYRVPAASVAVVQNGKIVKSQGYGMANVELSVPATDKTVYELGSITKQFTAVAIITLVEAGKLTVDEAVANILPDLPTSWSGVTVRHLLTHTSGIKSYTSLPNFMELTRKDVSHDEVIKSVADQPLEFKPGEKWNYSNTGYFLLGMVVEKLSGKSYGDYLQEKIFGPLGMTSTRVNDLGAIIPNRACGYTRKGDEVRVAPAISMTWPFSAGVLISTVTDLAKWDAAVGTDKLLKKSSWDMIWTPVKLNGGATHPYGFGWGVDRESGHKMIGHGGGIPGFTTDMARYPDDGLAVVVLTNSDGGNPASLRKAIAREFVPALAAEEKAIADTEPEVTKLVRETLLKTADGSIKPEAFTKEMAAQIFPDRVKGAQKLLSDQGPLESLKLVKRNEDAGTRNYEYLARFKSLTIRVIVALTRENKIAGMGMRPE